MSRSSLGNDEAQELRSELVLLVQARRAEQDGLSISLIGRPLIMIEGWNTLSMIYDAAAAVYQSAGFERNAKPTCPPLHTIRKVKFLSKKSIMTKQNFTIFSGNQSCQQFRTFSRVFQPKFFWQFFSWNQSCQQLKSPKPQHFHEFSPKTIRQFFLRKSKLNFWTKNEDFEQCARGD